MRRLRDMAPELLPLVIAIVVPLAGVVIAAQIWLTGDQRRSLRVVAACVLGLIGYAIIFTT